MCLRQRVWSFVQLETTSNHETCRVSIPILILRFPSILLTLGNKLSISLFIFSFSCKMGNRVCKGAPSGRLHLQLDLFCTNAPVAYCGQRFHPKGVHNQAKIRCLMEGRINSHFAPSSSLVYRFRKAEKLWIIEFPRLASKGRKQADNGTEKALQLFLHGKEMEIDYTPLTC